MRLQRESGESITAVARRLGMSAETLRNWVRRDEVERGEREGLTIAEHAEIRELRRQVRRLEEEKLILQKAAAYFARETGLQGQEWSEMPTLGARELVGV